MPIHPLREWITKTGHPHLWNCAYTDELLQGYTQALGFTGLDWSRCSEELPEEEREDNPNPLFEGSGDFDSNWDVIDEIRDLLAPVDRNEILSDLESFLHLCKEARINPCSSASRAEKAGTDFHFTRNGHGAGFWDGDWQKLGERLTTISKTMGTCELNGIRDDGGELTEVYLSH